MAATLQPPPDSAAQAALPERTTLSVSLLDVDGELTAGIPAPDRALAHRVLVRPRYEIPKGRWSPQLLRAHENGAFAILLVEGVILRQLDLVGRHCMHILGPGDVLQPAGEGGLLDCPVSWTALRPSSIVVLDDRFTRASQRWPSLALNLHRRLLDQADRVALHAAVAQLPRVDRRILALFWQLAERWGRVTSSGVELTLELTHETIGRLVGAQRPTVTLALRELADEGALSGGAGRTWVLQRASRQALAG